MIRPVLRPDDPAVTAYALGELSDTERAAVDFAAATNPAVSAAIDEATAAAGVLSAALKQEMSSDAGPVLDSTQHAAILERAAAGAPILSFTSRLRRWGLFAATAAAVMVGAFVVAAKGPPSTKVSDISAIGQSQPPPPGGVGRIRLGDGDSLVSGISEPAIVRPVPSLRRVDSYLTRGFGSGSEPVRAGERRGSVRRNADLIVGTPTNPDGSAFAPPKVNLIPIDRVNDESNPLFGGKSEATVVQSGVAEKEFAIYYEEGRGSESYRSYIENAFRIPKGELALSTFSIDVDTASYANVRRMLNEGHLPNPDAVRVEELVNYFPYAYATPAGDDPFAVNLEVAGCPWNAKHRLVRICIKGKDVAKRERPASNLVFLLDVSGSMNAPNKLPLVKASLRMLLDELNERDKVSIVVYAGSSGMALPPTSCEKKNTILEAIDKLVPSGSTNGAAGVELAYQTAVSSFIPGGVNRVVLCTDGDFNVGNISHDGLLALISEKAKSKVFLTALGFGMGNYKDDTLELLADKGNGNYGYIDSTREAHKVLVEQSSGTLVTIAKDVKLQVEFNPATVAAYRLVGYDNRLLSAKDFNDDTKDAGEIGAGHTVTAFYEIVPIGVELPQPSIDKPASVDPLKYQPPAAPTPPPPPSPHPTPAPAPVVFSPTYSSGAVSPEMMTVKLRWKAPEGDVSTKKEFPLSDAGASIDKASQDFQFSSAVTAFALLLKQSPYRGTANFDGVIEIAASSLGTDPGGWRAEFVDLVKKAKSLVSPK